MNNPVYSTAPPPHPRIRSCWCGLLLWLWCSVAGLLVTPAQAAEPYKLQLVVSANHDVFREFANTFTAVSRLPNWRISRQETGAQELPAADLYLAVGLDAARQLAEQDSAVPVMCVLLSRAQFESLQWQHSKRAVTALWQDPPPARQLALLKALLPGVRRVGYLHAEADNADLSRVRQAASALELDLLAKAGDRTESLREALPGLLQDSGALLAGTSPAVYNRDSLGVILPAAYRAERVLIGSSQAVVRAGALASTFSSPLQIATDVREWLLQLPGPLPAARYPTHFDVAVNDAVGRSLGIPMTDTNELVKRVRKDAPCPELCP